MNTSKLFSLRNLALTAMSLLAMIFAMSDAKAQEGEPVHPTTISTEINNLPANNFPLTVETNYEHGTTARSYAENGVYDEVPAEGFGGVTSATVNGVRVPVGGTGTYNDAEGNGIIIIVYYDGSRLVVFVWF